MDAIGGSGDPVALDALTWASEVMAVIWCERSLRKLAFGIPVVRLRLPEAVRADWDGIASDVLAGNNAARAQVSFADEFGVEFAPPAAP